MPRLPAATVVRLTHPTGCQNDRQNPNLLDLAVTAFHVNCQAVYEEAQSVYIVPITPIWHISCTNAEHNPGLSNAGLCGSLYIPKLRGMTMARNEKTSKTVASKAGKLLKNPKSTKAVKSVAASALTQAPDKSKGRKK